MTLREVPGTLVLGLLASLIAHAALFGGDHAAGGAYHTLLVELATAGSIGFAVILGTLAWSGGRYAADGSVLGTRLTGRLPGWGALSVAAAFWFALGENLEPQHAGAGQLFTVLCLLGAAWIVRAVARGAMRLLAAAVIATARQPFAARTPVWARAVRPTPIARRSPLLRRRFARPPPIANARA